MGWTDWLDPDYDTDKPTDPKRKARGGDPQWVEDTWGPKSPPSLGDWLRCDAKRGRDEDKPKERWLKWLAPRSSAAWWWRPWCCWLSVSWPRRGRPAS